MKNLFVFTLAMTLFAQANAVTPSKSSSSQIKETPVQDTQLKQQLEQEVEAENPTSSKAQTANNSSASDELTIDSDTEMSDEVAAAEAQQIITQVQKNKKVEEKNIYLSAVIGTGVYPDVNNITGSYSAALAGGYIYRNAIMLEGGIGLTRYEMDVLSFSILNRRDNYEIDQYSAYIGAKYRILEGRIVPTIGGLISYTYRKFSLTNPYLAAVNTGKVDAGNSTTTDGGITAGLDYEFSRDFAIGVDFKYMINIANSKNSESNNINSSNFNGYSGTTIEKLQYYMAGVSARMNF
jgi:hypothetical protein